MEQQYFELNLKDAFIFKPKIHKDSRGTFHENFNLKSFKDFSGIDIKFFQENVSLSKKNVLRGLHFQKKPHAQSKLISVLRGSVLDVIVDIRMGSDTFGKSISYILDDIKKESIFVPKGFAHGFLSLEDNTILSYKVNSYYELSSECTIKWNDKFLNINWSEKEPILSKKDHEAITFEENIQSKNF